MKRTALLLLPVALATGCFFPDSVDPIYEIDDDEIVVVQPFKEPGVDSPWDSTLGHQLAEATSRALRANVDFIVRPYGEVLELLIAKPKGADDDEKKKKAKDGDDDDDGEGKKKPPASDADLGPDVREFEPEKLAQLTDANYVVVATIKRFETRERLNINMRKGTGTIEVRLFKIATTDDEKQTAKEKNESLERRNKAREKMGLAPLGKLPYGGKFVARAKVTARYPDDFLNQYGDPFLDDLKIREGLIRALGEKVAKLLYEHDREPLEGMGGKGTGN